VGSWPERVRRTEDDAVLNARVVVELHTESHAAKPSTRAWAITVTPTAATGWPASAPADPTNPRRGDGADAR
jgi:hypothetical protein